TLRCCSKGGAGGCPLGVWACRYDITSCQIGAAPLTPDTSRILWPWLLPTQTPTVYCSEKPRVQLSRISLLVPVFTAVQNRVDSALSRPNVRARARRSDNMSPTIQLAIGSNTCTAD